MTDTLVIRPATLADSDFILAANQAIDAENHMDKPSELSAQRLCDDVFCDAPKAFVLIAEQAGQPVGMAFYGFNYFVSRGQIIWLSNLFVADEARQQHVARRLIAHIKQLHPSLIICWATYETNQTMIAFSNKIGARFLDDLKMFGLKA